MIGLWASSRRAITLSWSGGHKCPFNLSLAIENDGSVLVNVHPIRLGGELVQRLNLGFEPDLIYHAQDLSLCQRAAFSGHCNERSFHHVCAERTTLVYRCGSHKSFHTQALK